MSIPNAFPWAGPSSHPAGSNASSLLTVTTSSPAPAEASASHDRISGVDPLLFGFHDPIHLV